MAGKKNKKKGTSTSKPVTSKRTSKAEKSDEDFDDELEDIKTDICLEHISPIISFLFKRDVTFGKIFSEFQKTFCKEYSQLTMGCFLVKVYDLLLLYEFNPGKRDRDDIYGADKDLACPRLILIYLIYRIREFDPWLKRKTEKNISDNMKGHIFLDFFINLASREQVPFDPNNILVSRPKVEPCELGFTRAILYQQGPKFVSVTPDTIYKTFNQTQVELYNPIGYSDLIQVSRDNLTKYMNLDRLKSSRTWPGVYLYILHKTHDYRNPSETMQDILAFKLAESLKIESMPFIKLVSPVQACCDFCVTDPYVPVEGEYGHLAFPEFSYDRPVFPPATYDFDFENYMPETIQKSLLTTSVVTPPPEPKPLKPKKTIVKEVHSETKIDGKSKPLVKLVTVEVEDDEKPECSSNINRAVNDIEQISPLNSIMPKLLAGEMLVPREINVLQVHLENSGDDDNFFKVMNGFDPKLICNYVESNVKFASYLVYRVVKREPIKLFVYVDVMKEMGFSVQCVETVLRLYRNINDIPKLALLDYFNFLMQFCDQEATTSSQKRRYVRIFCTFVKAILNDGIIGGDKIDEYSRNSLQQILTFIVRYSEYKEAMELYKRIQEVLKKWDS